MENEDVNEQPSAEDRCINQVTCIFICHLAHGSSESALASLFCLRLDLIETFGAPT